MKAFAQDTQAQGTRAAISIILAITVGIIVASVLIPVAIDELEGNETVTQTQDVDTTYQISGELESNLTSVTTGTTDTATVELNDTRTSGTTSNTIDNGSTVDYSLDGGTVTVGVEDVDDTTSPNQATLNYTYEKDYSYSDGASALWGILGLTIVLGVFIYVIRLAVDKV